MSKKARSVGRAFIICGMAVLCFALALLIKEAVKDQLLKRSNRALIGQIRLEISDREDVPPGMLNPNAEMPGRMVNGRTYIGTIEIPSLKLELPVVNDCSDENLKQSPCRYYGSVYQDRFVIAGHNYASQFGSLYRLRADDAVIFRDMDGAEHRYAVREIETMSSFSVEKMTEGSYPLTLFTCTLSRQSRIAVRCVHADEAAAQPPIE